MKMKYLIAMIFLLGFSFFVRPAFAVSIQIDSSPDTITDQPFTLDVSLSGAQPGQNYLRVDIYKDGTSNYFGETSVGANWYSGSDGVSYVPVTIPDSTTVVTASLQARIGTPSPNDFPGTGSYKIKIRRYTASGSQGEVTQTPVDVQINYSLPTPTPLPTFTPTPTITPRTPTPTKMPTPTKLPTSSPTPINKPLTPTKSVESLEGKEGEMPPRYPTAILGVSDKVSPTPEKKEDIIIQDSSHKQGRSTILAVILCAGGGSMLGICGILVYLKKRRGEI